MSLIIARTFIAVNAADSISVRQIRDLWTIWVICGKTLQGTWRQLAAVANRPAARAPRTRSGGRGQRPQIADPFNDSTINDLTLQRSTNIRVHSWLTSCAGHRTREHCALSAMLTVSQLSKSFAGRALFDDVSLQVNRGDRIGLVGPNGAGKSTLFALLLGDVSADKGTIAIEKNATIGFLPQEPPPP